MHPTGHLCISYIENRKEECPLAATGYLQVHAYTSYAQIPLEGVSVSVTDSNGKGIAMRLTNQSGQLDTPIPITVPDLSASQRPDTGVVPFTRVNVRAKLTDFEEIDVEDVQIFADTVTSQNLELIPLAELPAKWNKAEIFRVPTQNL